MPENRKKYPEELTVYPGLKEEAELSEGELAAVAGGVNDSGNSMGVWQTVNGGCDCNMSGSGIERCWEWDGQDPVTTNPGISQPRLRPRN